MARNLIETLMGAVVLAVAVGFLSFAYNQASVGSVDGYRVKAKFSDISGINTGSEIRVAGMKVGVVEELELNPETYQAIAVMQIQDQVKLPKDTSAAVSSNGLLGDKFIKLDPGGDDAMLAAGDVISFTQSSVSIEELIGKFVFSDGGVDNAGSATNKPAPAAPPAEEEPAKKDNPFSLGF